MVSSSGDVARTCYRQRVPMLEMRALVLDDDATWTGLLSRSLRSTVREVDQATDCRRALELFAAHRHPVVVLDLMMPEMSGFDVMREMHRIAPYTQVIMVTGYSSTKHAIEAVNRHAFGFLEKPCDLKELQVFIADAFAHYQHQVSAIDSAHGDAESDAEIGALYSAVAQSMAASEQSPHDPRLKEQYRQDLDRLRIAQAAEAERASRAFRGQLALEPGTGYAAIEAARRVLDATRSS